MEGLNLELDALVFGHNHFRGHSRTFDQRTTDDAGTTAVRDQHVAERQLITVLGFITKIDSQNVALTNFVLTATIFNYREHASTTFDTVRKQMNGIRICVQMH